MRGKVAEREGKGGKVNILIRQVMKGRGKEGKEG